MSDEFDKTAETINSKLKDIFADESIELASCIFAFKNSDQVLVAEKGHHYDITKLLANVLRDHQERVKEETGLN